MIKKLRYALVVMLSACLLSACSLMDPHPPSTLYDLGPLQLKAMGQLPADMPVIATRVHAPDWMEESLMIYRLDYVNNQQVRYYTQSSWASSPTRLFKHRLDAYLMSIGNRAASTLETDSFNLQIIFEDFSQHFSDERTSMGRVAIRAILFKGQELIAQQRFLAEIPADTADAAGGSQALSKGVDRIIANMMNWIVIKSAK